VVNISKLRSRLFRAGNDDCKALEQCIALEAAQAGFRVVEELALLRRK
jgi:hypothetical protein